MIAKMTTMDFGTLFGLDLMGCGKNEEGSLDLLEDRNDDGVLDLPASEFQDILNLSLQENGITETVVHHEIVSYIFALFFLFALYFSLTGTGNGLPYSVLTSLHCTGYKNVLTRLLAFVRFV